MPGTVNTSMDSLSSTGVALSYASTKAGSYTTIADVIDISTPKIKHNTFEDKTLDQADLWIPKLGAFVDGGQATFTIKFNGARYGLFLGIVDDKTPTWFKVTVPMEAGQTGGATILFPALVGEMGLPFKEDGGRLILDVTLEVAGKVEFTAGATS